MGRDVRNRILFLIGILMVSPACDTNKNITYTKVDGIYVCKQSSTISGTLKYIVEIDQVVSQENLLIISNFLNQGDLNFIYCEKQGDSLYIRDQQLASTTINGKGVIADDFKLVMLEYTTDNGSIIVDYFAEYTR